MEKDLRLSSLGVHSVYLKTDFIRWIESSVRWKMIYTGQTLRLKVSASTIWATIRKHSYSQKALQALCELIDNSITAILEVRKKQKKHHGKISIKIDFDKRSASIEDNGTGFSNDMEKLSVAWSYGYPNPHGLSEHGCGAKSSLSIFDITNSQWSVYWKNGDGKIYMIKAPLLDNIDIYEVETWPGEYNEKTGVFMAFPFPDECISSLYSPGAKRRDDAEQRCRMMISQMYMNHKEFTGNHISIYLNEEQIQPFKLLEEDIRGKPEEKEFTLKSGGKIKVRLIEIKHEIKNSWFKNTQSSMGVYIDKNGRHIQHISGGELFTKLTGRASHPSFAGKFVLMSFVGEQNQLPATDPTKSCMNQTDPLFEETCELIRDYIDSFYSKGNSDIDSHERDHIIPFRETRMKNLSTVIPTYTITTNKKYDSKTPALDLLEEFPDGFIVYEGKRDRLASWAAIHQLYANYLIFKNVSPKPIKKAVLLINASSVESVVNPELSAWIAILRTYHDFPLEIWNYKSDVLWTPIAE